MTNVKQNVEINKQTINKKSYSELITPHMKCAFYTLHPLKMDIKVLKRCANLLI